MTHHLDRLVASNLSQQVLEMRRLRGELGSQALDSTNQRLYPLPSVLAQREAFIADASIAELNPIPVWHYRGRKG